MTSEWREITLGDFVGLQRGHDLTEPERRVGRVPVMGSAGQNGFHDTALAKGPGIVIGRSGASFGQVHFSPLDYWPHNTALYVTDFKGNDPRFAFYFLKALDFDRFNSGSAQPSLNRNFIYPIPVRIPPLAEQEAIAAVLGALDDKIELNRRMKATLEAMTRALFQRWFVDFDPVRAKLDGHEPIGLDPATAALFPNEFEDSELGRIPKGWTLGKIGDVSTLSRTAINPGDFPNETFDHFSLPAFDAGRNPKVELGGTIMSNKLAVTQNAVLLSKLNPHIPRVWLPDLHQSRRSVCSTEFMVSCSKPGVSREYLFSLFTSSAFVSVYGTLVTGTTGSHQRIRPESVLEMTMVIPPRALIQAFTNLAKPMFDHINRSTEQSRNLVNVRDALLPKLLSGKLKVPQLP
jgi:type I restriction enzyme S subunit